MSLESRIKKLEQSLSKPQEQTWPVLQKFWCGNYPNPDGSTCCFWHWRGLPRRWGKRHPIYSWQQNILDDLDNGFKYFATLKGPKLGATEFWLSYFLYKSLYDKSWRNGQVAILVGINKPESQYMIQRAKEILAVRDEQGELVRDTEGQVQYRVPIDYSYNNKDEFTVNTVRWAAHPAGHYDAIRAKPNMKAILGDEIAFFIKKKLDQQAIRDAFEHYRGGADTIVSLITTSGEVPAGFAFDIFHERGAQKPSDAGYRQYILGVEAGLEIHPDSKTSLYDPAEIEKIRGTPSFKRNYEHQWGADAGNVWSFEKIEACTKIPYDLSKITGRNNSLGIDPAYGSSKFAFTVSQLEKGIIQVLYADEIERADPVEMVQKTVDLIYKYRIEKVFVDASDPGFIKAVKRMVRERVDYENVIEEYPDNYEHMMRIVPVGFRRNTTLEKNSMISWAQELVSSGQVAIDKSFTNLLTQMRSARTKVDGKLDKDDAFTMDLIDSLFLNLRRYRYRA